MGSFLQLLLQDLQLPLRIATRLQGGSLRRGGNTLSCCRAQAQAAGLGVRSAAQAQRRRPGRQASLRSL